MLTKFSSPRSGAVVALARLLIEGGTMSAVRLFQVACILASHGEIRVLDRAIVALASLVVEFGTIKTSTGACVAATPAKWSLAGCAYT